MFLRPKVGLVFCLVWLLLLGACNDNSPNSVPWDPSAPGPHTVGFVQLDLYDAQRERELPTAVWYPASSQDSADKVYYLAIMQMTALDQPEPATRLAPYPLVMFSHGNQGVGVQSPSLCEHLASHGFVVAAPNHTGNTLLDDTSGETMAQSAIDRPSDMVFVLDEMIRRSQDQQDVFFQMVDEKALGVAGHSFGGYTALLLAGAEVHVAAAKERCKNDIPGDIFCPSVPYWPDTAVFRRPDGARRFRASLALAAGSWGAFGAEGLADVDMPVMLMGGSLDEFTVNDIRPIYQALPTPKYKLEIAGAGHMSFTDLCRLGLPVPELEALCDPDTYLDLDRGQLIINTFATAFLRYKLKGEGSYASMLKPGSTNEFPEAELVHE